MICSLRIDVVSQFFLSVPDFFLSASIVKMVTSVFSRSASASVPGLSQFQFYLLILKHVVYVDVIVYCIFHLGMIEFGGRGQHNTIGSDQVNIRLTIRVAFP